MPGSTRTRRRGDVEVQDAREVLRGVDRSGLRRWPGRPATCPPPRSVIGQPNCRQICTDPDHDPRATAARRRQAAGSCRRWHRWHTARATPASNRTSPWMPASSAARKRFDVDVGGVGSRHRWTRPRRAVGESGHYSEKTGVPHMYQSGRHFLQLPGPSNVPDRVLRAMGQPTIDHRSPAFGELGREVLDGLKPVFGTTGPVVIFPSSGSGGWEAALVNTLSPGDRVAVFETGRVRAALGRDGEAARARRAGVRPSTGRAAWIPPRRRPSSTTDRDHRIRAVLVVHNETSTGATTRLPEIRKAIDRAKHPALLLVDAVSSAGSMELQHDAWGIDVTLAGSQKGLMLPPGLELQRHQPEGAGGVEDRAAAAVVLGLGLHARVERDRLLHLHAGDHAALRPARGAVDAARGRTAPGLRQASPAGESDPRGGRGLGVADRLHPRGRVQQRRHDDPVA